MSYDIRLSKTCDNKVVWDDHIVEDDLKTVILGVPTTSSNVVVRINDFKRQHDYLAEILLKEDLSAQVTGATKNFFVAQGPIYDGLKLGQLASRFEDVIVKVEVVNEDVTEQFTGVEDYFFTQGRPLIRSNEYDFNSFIEKSDIEIEDNIQRAKDAVGSLKAALEKGVEITSSSSSASKRDRVYVRPYSSLTIISNSLRISSDILIISYSYFYIKLLSFLSSLAFDGAISSL